MVTHNLLCDPNQSLRKNLESKCYSGTYTTNSYTPLASATRVGPSVRMYVEGEDGGGNIALSALANVLVADCSAVQVLTNNGHFESRARLASRKTPGAVTLNRGTFFINPTCDMTIRTAMGEVHARKGSFLYVSVEEGELRVAACSGPGHIRITANGKSIDSTIGQEVVVAPHEISSEQMMKEDGIGRRRFNQFTFGSKLHAATCDISLISFISNCECTQSLVRPTTAVEKRIAGALLKSAAAVGMITTNDGVYRSRGRSRTHAGSPMAYAPGP